MNTLFRCFCAKKPSNLATNADLAAQARAIHPLVRLAPNTAAGVTNCVPPSALRAPSPAGGGRESIA